MLSSFWSRPRWLVWLFPWYFEITYLGSDCKTQNPGRSWVLNKSSHQPISLQHSQQTSLIITRDALHSKMAQSTTCFTKPRSSINHATISYKDAQKAQQRHRFRPLYRLHWHVAHICSFRTSYIDPQHPTMPYLQTFIILCDTLSDNTPKSLIRKRFLG